jgi:hypothetical protein
MNMTCGNPVEGEEKKKTYSGSSGKVSKTLQVIIKKASGIE